jgi:hypothetical protein
MEQRNLISIFIGGFGIAIIVLFFLWLRVNDINLFPESRSSSDVIYFLPYILVLAFGSIMGGFIKNKYNHEFNLHFLQRPFLSLWVAVVIFIAVSSLWFARPDHFVENRTYLADVFSNVVILLPLSVVQIIFPFFIGYSLTKIIGRGIVKYA